MKKIISFVLALCVLASTICFTASAESFVYIEDGGVFNIVAADTAYALDVKGQSKKDKADIHLWERGSQISQQFVFYKVDNEYYKIMNINSGKYLDVSGNKNKSSTPIIQYSYHGGDNQLFRFVNAGDDGSYYIQSKLGKYLDCRNGEFSNGVKLQIYKGNQTKAQKFYLDPVVKNNTSSFCYTDFRPNAFEAIVDNVPVKAQRSHESETLYTLDKNAVIFVNESCVNDSNNHWYTVTVDGVICYIFGGYLKEYKRDTVKVYKSILDAISDCLVVASFVPVLDTATNLVSIPVDALRGDYTGALLSAVAIIPVYGELADAAKVADKAVDANKAIKTAKKADKISDATKVVYKNLDDGVNFTKTTIDRMSNPSRYVPVEFLIDAIKHGKPMADPQGSKAIMYTTEMIKNGKVYTLEVLYDKASNTILHFLYK